MSREAMHVARRVCVPRIFSCRRDDSSRISSARCHRRYAQARTLAGSRRMSRRSRWCRRAVTTNAGEPLKSISNVESACLGFASSRLARPMVSSRYVGVTRPLAVASLLSVVLACSSSSDGGNSLVDTGASSDARSSDEGVDSAEAAIDTAPPVDEAALIKARPFEERAPKSYDGSKAVPLLLLLHGFGVDGATQLAIFGFDALVDARNVIVAYPDGTEAPDGRFWNATDACCGAGRGAPDDVAYLVAVVHDVQKRYRVDPKQIFVTGHSNGAFMAHRLACERADLFASALSLAGAQWLDVSRCKPSRPIAIAQVHGDADATILYGGGTTTGADGSKHAYPSASQTVADWAKLDGCTGALTDSGTSLDLEASLAGNETKVSRYTSCPAGVSVELWTIQGGGHIPLLTAAWGPTVMDFLQAHPMP
jgi:polyhydroxybutyrate depolymerase